MGHKKRWKHLQVVFLYKLLIILSLMRTNGKLFLDNHPIKSVLFAWKVCKHVKSNNAIVVTRDHTTQSDDTQDKWIALVLSKLP